MAKSSIANLLFTEIFDSGYTSKALLFKGASTAVGPPMNPLISSFLPIPAPRSSEPRHAALEQQVVNHYLENYEKMGFLELERDPRNIHKILGVKDQGSAKMYLEQAQETAHQWVSSGEAAQFLQEAKQGRDQFLELSSSNPEQAYALVRMVEQASQMNTLNKLSDVQLAEKEKSGVFIGVSDPNRLSETEKSLAAIRTASYEVLYTMLQKPAFNDAAILDQVNELSNIVQAPATLGLAIDLLDDTQKSLERLSGAPGQSLDQVTFVTRNALDELTTIAVVYPHQMPAIVEFVSAAERLERSFLREGTITPEAQKDFSEQISQLRNDFATYRPLANEQALDQARGVLTDLRQLTSDYSERFNQAIESHAPPLTQRHDTPSLGDNAAQMGFLGAIAETSGIFQAARSTGQFLSDAEKVSMMPAVAQILSSSLVLEGLEPKTASEQPSLPYNQPATPAAEVMER